MSYNTELYWDGQSPKIVRKEELIKYLEGYAPNTWFSLEVLPLGFTNSTSQSKLYHKWKDILADAFGWTTREMHNHLKVYYNGGKSTKDMTTKEWSDFMIKILAWAGEEEIVLPLGLQE